MYIDKERFEAWMERIMERFNFTDRALERMNKQYNMLDGERLYDNQDVCQLLNISKRTLQRYRSNRELPYHTIYHKTYYKESDIHTFIRTHFEKNCEQTNVGDDENSSSNENKEYQNNENTNDNT